MSTSLPGIRSSDITQEPCIRFGRESNLRQQMITTVLARADDDIADIHFMIFLSSGRVLWSGSQIAQEPKIYG